jgi:hypothetical protein
MDIKIEFYYWRVLLCKQVVDRSIFLFYFKNGLRYVLTESSSWFAFLAFSR